MKKIKSILLLILPLVAITAGYLMSTKELWGYEILVLFLSIWLFLVVFFEKKFTRLHNHRRYIGQSLLSGVLLWLGFPSLGLSPLLLLAFVPLLAVERDISLHYGGTKKREVFKFAFVTAMTWNILSTYWVGNSALFAGIFAVVANSLLMTIPFVLGHVVKHRTPKLKYAPLVCFWLAFEYLHLRWDLSWPWLTLGNGFASFHSWIQWYDITGVLGGSLWIWICNISIFNLWNRYKKQELTMFKALSLAVAFIIPLAISIYKYYNFKEGTETIEVVCMQPNYEPHYIQGNDSNIEVLTKCMKDAEGIIDSTTNYVLFPESTFGGLVDRGDWDENDVIHAFKIITGMEFPDLNILAGATVYAPLTKNDADLPSTRMQIRGRDTTYFHAYNGAIQVGAQKVQTYKKSKLVIGPEYLPFGNYLGFLEDRISKMGGTLKGLATQEERAVFESKKGNAAPVICYEQNFGEFMRGYIANGADFIAIVTNDGWWGYTDGYRQHREFARLRAIEYRRSIARAANTGSSCFINARGDMQQATDYGVTAVIKQDIALNNCITTYYTMGDFIGRLAGFLGILFLLNGFVVGRLKNKEK
ncbi:MAG: apolipoprotein N-acyltransferase [Maribacter sp.]|jgi:apolipoprotein N-acyltransferase